MIKENYVIEDYKEINKGCLKASFSITILSEGVTICNCTLFEKGSHQWVSMPCKEVPGDGKTKYYPHIKFYTETLRDEFLNVILSKVKAHVQKNPRTTATQKSTSELQSETSDDCGEMPF